MDTYRLAKLNDRGSDLSKIWYVFYSVLNPENRKYQLFQIYISKKLITKKARYQKADEIIRSINTKLIKGWTPFSEEIKSLTTVEDALTKFMDIKETELRKRSSYTYRSIIQILLEWCKKTKISSMPIELFSYQQAVDFLDYLKKVKKVSNKTYNNYRRAINTAFNWLLLREYVMINVWKRTTKLREEQPEVIAFTPSELRKIQVTLPVHDKRLWMIAQLIFYCFLRPQEIVRLRFMDFNMELGRISINGSQSKNRNTQVINIPKAFMDQINVNDWMGNPTDYIFSRGLNPGQKQMLPIRIAERWSAYSKKVNIRKPIYGLKHTGVGMAFDNGINPRDLQIHIRHASLDETMKYLNRFRNVVSDKLKYEFPSFS